MDRCQKALIRHLESANITNIRTIDAYAGQIKDAHKLAQLCPAALVLYKDGQPLKEKTHVFDIIVITLNKGHDKKKNQAGNLHVVSAIADFLDREYLFAPVDAVPGRYEILRDEASAQTILNDNMFCIVALTIPVRDWT